MVDGAEAAARCGKHSYAILLSWRAGRALAARLGSLGPRALSALPMAPLFVADWTQQTLLRHFPRKNNNPPQLVARRRSFVPRPSLHSFG